MKDKWNRNINYMRISVTDQCNLRCCYCMPEEGIACLNKEELLTFDELEAIVKAGVNLGIDTIKITGGEPLVRKNITDFIKQIKNIEGMQQVTLTTNGVLLKKYAEELKVAGIDSININLPSIYREEYAAITRRDEFLQVLEGIKTAKDLGLRIKLNCVARESMTEAELYGYGMIAKQYPIDVRFIEMMPIGFGRNYDTYANNKVLKHLEDIFKTQAYPSNTTGNGPAVYYEFNEFLGKVGFISAVTHKFCATCNRVRLSANGDLKLCLNYDMGVSLKEVLRNGKTEMLQDVMEQAIYTKPQAHCFYEENNNIKVIKLEKKDIEARDRQIKENKTIENKSKENKSKENKSKVNMIKDLDKKRPDEIYTDRKQIEANNIYAINNKMKNMDLNNMDLNYIKINNIELKNIELKNIELKNIELKNMVQIGG